MTDALRAIRAIFAGGFLPSALELADEFTLRAAHKRTGSPLLAGCEAHLIVELDGQERSVRSEIKQAEEIVRCASPRFVQRGLGSEASEAFWQLRREFPYALRDTGLTKLNEDVVVPRGRLEELFQFTARLQKRYGMPIACFGHAGDGNIHVNVMIEEKNARAAQREQPVLDELFRKVIALGGAITGEHGIGLAKKPWWRLAVGPGVKRLHRVLKRALDPHGILNPGKFAEPEREVN
jgi:FAD/FMN-containing dehydrogenase